MNVFVLMLENRSYDHMLGYSDIDGADAASGQATRANGLAGNESNMFQGVSYGVRRGADWTMPVDPGHEFLDVVEQLGGTGAVYPGGGPYPVCDNSGFVANYVATCGAAHHPGDPGEILKCYSPEQLPVLNALAREFVICDNWHASLPGPTWPNRMFVHAASSGGLDHSPTTAEIVLWETIAGFDFPNGTIFDALQRENVTRRLYGGDDFPLVAAVKGIGHSDIRPFVNFARDLQGGYPYAYTFIEPSYNATADYKCSTSQHPMDDVTRGEALIKCTYEAIRNSPLWSNSLLIVTWDEHGGFYDHVHPPAATNPNDTVAGSGHNKYGFTFQQYGPRVPGLAISPLIPRNLVDHRVYDHASIPATLERLFGLDPLTERDRGANDLTALLTLKTARADAPAHLPSPAGSGVQECPRVDCFGTAPGASTPATPPVSSPAASINAANLPGVLQAAMRRDLMLSPPEEKPEILARVSSLQNRADASEYLADVSEKIRATEA